MPGYDGRGPGGMGPMSGGGRGYCVISAGACGIRSSLGRNAGRGGGRVRRNMYYAAGMEGWRRSGLTPEQEKEVLKGEAELLKKELSDIQGRIGVLDNKEGYGENNK